MLIWRIKRQYFKDNIKKTIIQKKMISSTSYNAQIQTIRIFSRIPINCSVVVNDNKYMQTFTLSQSDWIAVEFEISNPEKNETNETIKEPAFMSVQQLDKPITVSSAVSCKFDLDEKTLNQLVRWFLRQVLFNQKYPAFCLDTCIASPESDDTVSLFDQMPIRTNFVGSGSFAKSFNWVEFVLPN